MKIYNLPEKKKQRSVLRSSATPQEVKLWARLRRSQLGHKFRRQHSIGRFIVDFYCPSKKLIIELDGSGHKSRTNIDYDRNRTKILENFGHRVMRFDNNDVDQNREGIIMEIEESLI